jgi:hypothetical protein
MQFRRAAKGRPQMPNELVDEQASSGRDRYNAACDAHHLVVTTSIDIAVYPDNATDEGKFRKMPTVHGVKPRKPGGPDTSSSKRFQDTILIAFARSRYMGVKAFSVHDTVRTAINSKLPGQRATCTELLKRS